MPDHERIAILTDSSSDLTAEMARVLGITIVSFAVRFGHDTFADGKEISTGELIARTEGSDVIPAVSSPAPHAFEQAFLELAADHDRVIAILISSRLSSAVKSATIAAKHVQDRIAVDVVDSLNTSFGLGLQVLRAVDLLRRGVAAEILVTHLRSEVTLNHVVFFVETLEYLRRSGRVGKAPEILGSFLQLKPVLRIDEGQVIPFERARTHAKALDVLVAFARSIPAIDEIAVIYNTTPEDADALVPLFEQMVEPNRIRIVQFGAALTAHIGPGCVGVAIREKPVV